MHLRRKQQHKQPLRDGHWDSPTVRTSSSICSKTTRRKSKYQRADKACAWAIELETYTLLAHFPCKVQSIKQPCQYQKMYTMHRKELSAWLLTYCLSSSQEQQKKITKKHVTNRLKTQPGNWFADSLPAVQVPSMGKKQRKMHVSFMNDLTGTRMEQSGVLTP
jgi:hypothetical protein